MNKRQILASLNNIANTLDHSGFNKEADTITRVMVKLAEEHDDSYGKEPKQKIIHEFVDQAKRRAMNPDDAYHMMNQRLRFNGHDALGKTEFYELVGPKKSQ